MGCRAVTWVTHQLQPQREKLCEGRQDMGRGTPGEAEPWFLPVPPDGMELPPLPGTGQLLQCPACSCGLTAARLFFWFTVSLETIQKDSDVLALPSRWGTFELLEAPPHMCQRLWGPRQKEGPG